MVRFIISRVVSQRRPAAVSSKSTQGRKSAERGARRAQLAVQEAAHMGAALDNVGDVDKAFLDAVAHAGSWSAELLYNLSWASRPTASRLEAERKLSKVQAVMLGRQVRRVPKGELRAWHEAWQLGRLEAGRKNLNALEIDKAMARLQRRWRARRAFRAELLRRHTGVAAVVAAAAQPAAAQPAASSATSARRWQRAARLPQPRVSFGWMRWLRPGPARVGIAKVGAARLGASGAASGSSGGTATRDAATLAPTRTLTRSLDPHPGPREEAGATEAAEYISVVPLGHEGD